MIFKLRRNRKMRKRIQVGDIVAEVGNTGYSCGAHLHLEVFKCKENNKQKVINDCSELISFKWQGDFSTKRSELRCNPFDC